jgi:integrase/recombinase XerD
MESNGKTGAIEMAKKVQKIQMCVQPSKTFQEGFEEYLLDCKARNLREGTIVHYQNSIRQIYKHFLPDMLIADFDENTMPKFIVVLRENPDINDVSMGTYARDLKTLLRFFMKCKYLPRFEIKIPHTDKEPIETYSDEELRILLKKPNIQHCNFATYRSWVVINLLLSTGIRQNSLIHIKNKDIDFENSLLHVNVTKNRKPLLIPLNEDILNILHEYMKFRGGKPDDWLICSTYGEQLTKSSCYHAIWDYNHSRGLEKTGMHRFRHTFAKKWVTMGGSVVTLQKILGHSSLAITENYLNILTTDLQRDMKEFNILRVLNREYIHI